MAKKKTASSASHEALLTNALAEYEQTIESRPASFSKVRLITLQGEGGVDVIPEGSVVAYFAKKGSPLLESLAQAAEAGDLAALRKIHDRQKKTIERRIENNEPTKPIQPMATVPRFAELRYGGKTISRGVFLSTPSAVDVRVFAYNGGKLSPGQFRMVEYADRGRGVELDVLLIKRAPQLSALEKKILAQAPAEQAEMNISAELAFVGKILRAVVEGGRRVVRALVDVVTKTARVNPRIVTVGCPCPGGPVLAVVTATRGPGGPVPKTPQEISSMRITESTTAADLLNMRREMLRLQLYVTEDKTEPRP